MTVISKKNKWEKKKKRLSYKISMTAQHPRLVVYRSNRNIFVQIIDNVSNITICSSSSIDKDISKEILKANNKIDMSKVVAINLAKKLKSHKIKNVVFNRSGYQYHGRVQAIAETLRENGITL